MRHPLYQVDAFTSRLFGGNPAAVVLLEGIWPPDSVMLAIAAENNLAETAFLLAGGGEDPIPLRWFAPTMEIDLCGHATLASGHVLFTHGAPRGEVIRFATLSGELSVTRRGELLELDLPARPAVRVDVSDAVADALGARPKELWRARDLVAVFDSEEDIRALAPDFARIAALDAFAVAATAPGRDADYVSRFFVPKAGVPEDPATGSSHCSLTPYWAERLGKTRLRARQLSARGAEFTCELRGGRVGVAGGAVEYLRGEITLGDGT